MPTNFFGGLFDRNDGLVNIILLLCLFCCLNNNNTNSFGFGDDFCNLLLPLLLLFVCCGNGGCTNQNEFANPCNQPPIL